MSSPASSHSSMGHDTPLSASLNDLRDPALYASTTTRGRRPLTSDMDAAAEAFRVEDGSETSLLDRAVLQGNILLENPEAETSWYFRYFLGRVHENFVTTLSFNGNKETVILSVLMDMPGSMSALSSESAHCRCILWRKTGSERLLLPFRGKVPEAKRIFAEFGRGTPDKKIERIVDPDVQRHLVVLEEQEGAVHFKIGILLALHGQKVDDEMFSNETSTPAFDEFCAIMGERIPLKEWRSYRGGLDVKNGTTGEHSLYTVEFGKEVMFHVSTMLPYSKGNPQQVERKRHLGNDICNIVFQEDRQNLFSPELIKSKFNHIFAVVGKDHITGAYHVKVYSKNSVPEYGPPLPCPAVFTDPVELRHFLLAKLMNGEKSALSSPMASFATKRVRTLEALISSIRSTFLGKLSPRLPRKGRSSEDFRFHGQSIKVEKVMNGHAPTSMMGSAVAAAAGFEPWTPISVTSDFREIVLCGSSWGPNLVVATPTSVIQLSVAPHHHGQLEQRVLIEGAAGIVQLEIDENEGLMYILMAKGVDRDDDVQSKRKETVKGGQLVVVPLDELLHTDQPLPKAALKNFVVAGTKGATRFSISISSSHFICTNKLAVAQSRKVRVFQLSTTLTTGARTGVTRSFLMTAEISCSDNIDSLSFGCGNATGAGQLCVGLRSGEFQLIDVQTGLITPLVFPVDKVEVVTCLDVPCAHADRDSADREWLLCYNQTGVFKDTGAQTARGFDIKFSSRPRAVAYLFPYLLAFLPDSVEVITLINGNLVKSLPMAGNTLISSRRDLFFTVRTREPGVVQIMKISRDAVSGRVDAASSIPLESEGPLYIRKLSMAQLSLPELSSSLRLNSSDSHSPPSPHTPGAAAALPTLAEGEEGSESSARSSAGAVAAAISLSDDDY